MRVTYFALVIMPIHMQKALPSQPSACPKRGAMRSWWQCCGVLSSALKVLCERTSLEDCAGRVETLLEIHDDQSAVQSQYGSCFLLHSMPRSIVSFAPALCVPGAQSNVPEKSRKRLKE